MVANGSYTHTSNSGLEDSTEGFRPELMSPMGMDQMRRDDEQHGTAANHGGSELNGSVSQDGDSNMPPDFQPDLLFTTFDDMDFNSNLDWILQDPSAVEMLEQPSFFSDIGDTQDLTSQNRSISPPLSNTLLAAGASITGPNISATETQSWAPNRSYLPQRQEAGTPARRWNSSKPPQNHITLPALGSGGVESSSTSRFFPTISVDQDTREGMLKLLASPFEHNPVQSLDISRFPCKEKVEHCLDVYFAHFQPMLEVVHQPTFNPDKDLLVTLTMVCVGASYTTYTGAREFLTSLSELIWKLLAFLVDRDRRVTRTSSYITAQLLQGTLGYCGGSEKLFELSESCRSTLIHHAKCMGLFRLETSPVPQPDAPVEELWRKWIAAEGLRRLGWAVYKYDASVAYLHNNRPFLSTGDINLNLPGSAEHWAAESAMAWASLHPSSRTLPPTPRLRPTLRMLFDESLNPTEQIPDTEHCFLVLLTLVRMLWSLKEIRSSPINDLISPTAFDDGPKAILRVIHRLAVPITSLSHTHTKAEIDRLVHRMQLIHIAHIYAAGDLMNWLYPYLRNDSETECARIRMYQWAHEDPARTREVAYHCAQLMGLLRHYPKVMPLEPLLTFHAGVVLSCVAALIPTNAAREDGHGPSIPLDRLEPGCGRVSRRQEDWVRHGGAEQVSLYGVPSLCCATGRQQVLDQTATLLKRQTVFGVAENLAKVVLSLGTRDPNKEGCGGENAMQLLSTTLSPSTFPNGT